MKEDRKIKKSKNQKIKEIKHTIETPILTKL